MRPHGVRFFTPCLLPSLKLRWINPTFASCLRKIKKNPRLRDEGSLVVPLCLGTSPHSRRHNGPDPAGLTRISARRLRGAFPLAPRRVRLQPMAAPLSARWRWYSPHHRRWRSFSLLYIRLRPQVNETLAGQAFTGGESTPRLDARRKIHPILSRATHMLCCQARAVPGRPPGRRDLWRAPARAGAGLPVIADPWEDCRG